MKKIWLIGLLLVLSVLISACDKDITEEGAEETKRHIFKNMDVIKIYPNQDLLYEDSKGIEIGDIFVNNEDGEVIVSTTAEGNLLSALMDALDAARSTNLTLEFEGIDMIDGAEALVLYSRIIEPTD